MKHQCHMYCGPHCHTITCPSYTQKIISAASCNNCFNYRGCEDCTFDLISMCIEIQREIEPIVNITKDNNLIDCSNMTSKQLAFSCYCSPMRIHVKREKGKRVYFFYDHIKDKFFYYKVERRCWVMAEWINVNDRLPPMYEDVLCYADGHSFYVDFICSDGKWYDDVVRNNKITHWMPLPEVPRTPKERGGEK